MQDRRDMDGIRDFAGDVVRDSVSACGSANASMHSTVNVLVGKVAVFESPLDARLATMEANSASKDP